VDSVGLLVGDGPDDFVRFSGYLDFVNNFSKLRMDRLLQQLLLFLVPEPKSLGRIKKSVLSDERFLGRNRDLLHIYSHHCNLVRGVKAVFIQA
jgi:hypothetical protein